MTTLLIDHDLCVRPFRASDAPAFTASALESQATVGAWLPWCHPHYSVAEAETWFDACALRWAEQTAYGMGIFDARTDTLLGGISLNQITREHNFGNLGYWVRETRQRHGIAPRAVRRVAAFGFETLGLTRLQIVVPVNNRPSRRVAEKVGATFETVMGNRLVVRGVPSPAAMYALLPGQVLDGAPQV